MTNATELEARAKQEADRYIKNNWGSRAFENLAYDMSLYDHWLSYHDTYIDTHFGYPSNHLATNAACRLYDTDKITFEQWIGVTVGCHEGLWYITLP